MGYLKTVKAKLLTLFAITFCMANSAMAEAIKMGADGTVTGDIDLSKTVYPVAGAIFLALGGIVAIKWAISFIRRA